MLEETGKALALDRDLELAPATNTHVDCENVEIQSAFDTWLLEAASKVVPFFTSSNTVLVKKGVKQAKNFLHPWIVE